DLAALRRRSSEGESIRARREIEIFLQIIAHCLALTAACRDDESGCANQHESRFHIPRSSCHHLAAMRASTDMRACRPKLSATGATDAPCRFPPVLHINALFCPRPVTRQSHEMDTRATLWTSP